MNKSVRFLSCFITLVTLLMISGCSKNDSKSDMQNVSEKPVKVAVAEDDGVYIGSIRRLSGEFNETQAQFAFCKDGLIYLTEFETDYDEKKSYIVLFAIDPITGKRIGETVRLGSGEDIRFISDIEPSGDEYVFIDYRYEEEKTDIVLVRCAKDGTEICRKPISEINQIPEGNPYTYEIVCTEDYTFYVADGRVTMLDKEFKFKKTLLDAGFGRGCIGPDGMLYFLDDRSETVAKYDPKSDKLTEDFTTVISGFSIYPGGEDELLVSTGKSLKKVDTKTGDVTNLFEFAEVNLITYSIDCIYRDEEKDLHIIFEKDNSSVTLQDGTTVVTSCLASDDIKRYDKENAPHSDEIRIACVSMNSDLRTVISDYKLAHPDVRVKIKSYMDDYKDTSDMYAAIDRDIIDNVNYDIWILSGLDVNKYSSKGLFEDLMPYIENDSSFDLSKYYENALLSKKKDGKLYQLTASVTFSGYAADREVFGDAKALSFEDIMAARKKYYDIPFISRGDCNTVINEFLHNNDYRVFLGDKEDAYDFDTKEFRELLELAAEYPSLTREDMRNFDIEGEIRSGDAHFRFVIYTGALDYLLEKTRGCGKLTPYGISSLDGNAFDMTPNQSFAIASDSTHKEEAWEMLKAFLDASTDVYGLEFRVNRELFKEDIERQYESSKDGLTLAFNGGMSEIRMDREDVDFLLAIMEEAICLPRPDDTVYDIVKEETAFYFAGEKSLDEVINIIQKRVNLYLEENR